MLLVKPFSAAAETAVFGRLKFLTRLQQNQSPFDVDRQLIAICSKPSSVLTIILLL